MLQEVPRKKVACFDIDGTIFRSSLLIELVDVLIEQGSFPVSARERFAEAERDWVDRRGTYERYIEAVVASFMEQLPGLLVSDLDRAGEVVIARNRDCVYRFTRDLLGELKRDGYFLLAISHSPKMVLDRFCREYGFDKVYGRRYVIGPDERFTGEVLDAALYANKANVLNRACEEEHLTLEGSVGVGDTEGDIPMLSFVAKPICFNPNAALYAEARSRGWRVVVERKDVVYEMPNIQE
jgi:HAD superfamily hydrolase (TIGR01490 family)